MNSLKLANIFAAVFLVGAHASVNAELFDRGNGLIYDSEQNLTWMQNADVNGKLSVQDATSWVENLVYAGYDDWRLPTTTQFDDPSCLEDVRATLHSYALFYETHINCLGGEMERLTASADPFNNSVFQNVRDSRYWTSTIYRDEIDPCAAGGYCTLENDNGLRKGFYWQWDFSRKVKATLRGGNTRYVWAVRDGDVGDAPPAPEPEPTPVDPDIAVGSVTPNIYVPSFDDGADNIQINFEYYGTNDAGENLWKLQKFGSNSPAIVDINNGTYTSANQIHLPSVEYRGLISTQNLWLDLIYHSSLESGEELWKLKDFGENI